MCWEQECQTNPTATRDDLVLGVQQCAAWFWISPMCWENLITESILFLLDNGVHYNGQKEQSKRKWKAKRGGTSCDQDSRDWGGGRGSLCLCVVNRLPITLSMPWSCGQATERAGFFAGQWQELQGVTNATICPPNSLWEVWWNGCDRSDPGLPSGILPSFTMTLRTHWRRGNDQSYYYYITVVITGRSDQGFCAQLRLLE